jgi:hypothetical protein
MNTPVDVTSGAPTVGDSGSGSESVDNSTANVTAGYTFSDVWTSDFDNDNMTVDMILSKLNETLTIVGEVQTWFVNFFGPSGIVTLNITVPTVVVSPVTMDNSTGSALNSTEVGVPAGLEDIVDWIRR